MLRTFFLCLVLSIPLAFVATLLEKLGYLGTLEQTSNVSSNSWSPCSVSCGVGTQRRPSQDGQRAEERKCNAGCCPSDCRLTAWSDWSPCSVSCGTGEQKRTRQVSTKAKCGGRCTETFSEVRTCKVAGCPTDCVWSEWSDFGACSATCGNGNKTRTRYVAHNASYGGTNCTGSDTEVGSCDPGCCPVDCIWEEWAPWSQCVSLQRTRSRKAARLASCGGKECSGSVQETERCEAPCKPVDCVWSDWSKWSESSCSVTCGTGHQTRTRTINVHRECGGLECMADGSYEKRPCDTEVQCPKIVWHGEWSKWSECSITCGCGLRMRERRQTPKKITCKGDHCSETEHNSEPVDEREEDQCCMGDCIAHGRTWKTWLTASICTLLPSVYVLYRIFVKRT